MRDYIDLIGLGVALVSLLLVLFLVVKTFQQRQKIFHLEDSVDKLSHNMYSLQKDLKDILGYQNTMQNSVRDGTKDSIDDIYYQIKELHEMIKSDRSYFEEKIIKVENRAQDFGYLNGVSDLDEKRIIALYQKGWTVSSIAKELRIGRGEVEFILKLADI